MGSVTFDPGPPSTSGGKVGEEGTGRTAPRMAVRASVAVALLVVLFGFVLPRSADYGQVRQTVTAMSGDAIALLVAAGLWNLITYWPVMMFALPGLRLGEAAVANQASTAVANTVPGGAAIALGVTYRMLRAWGFTRQSIANLLFVTGVWNQLVKLGMPLIAVGAVAVTGEEWTGFVGLAVWGAAGVGVTTVGGALVLRSERAARQLGSWLDRTTARLRRAPRPSATSMQSRIVEERPQFITLLRRFGVRLTVASLVSHLSLYLVLLAALRSVDVGPDVVSWPKSFLAFSLVRLLSAVPVTPGGVGLVELGYIGLLTTGPANGYESQVTAAVLLFRTITFVSPILIGAAASIAFHTASGWRRPPDSRGDARRPTGGGRS